MDEDYLKIHELYREIEWLRDELEKETRRANDNERLLKDAKYLWRVIDD